MSDGMPVPVGVDRLLVDVNALAIALVEDHPGYPSIRPIVDEGLEGAYRLVVFDYHPLRAQYILTADFGVDRIDARNAIQSLLRQPLQIVGASQETLRAAYDISVKKNHDVFDCFLLALGRQHAVEGLVTTDTDFDRLCSDEPFTYVNPVPSDVLRQFDEVEG